MSVYLVAGTQKHQEIILFFDLQKCLRKTSNLFQVFLILRILGGAALTEGFHEK